MRWDLALDPDTIQGMSPESPKSPKSPMKPMNRDPGQTICFCHNVTYGELLKAIAEGATTIEAIREQTCANTGCGGCEYEVSEILEEELAKPDLAKVAAK